MNRRSMRGGTALVPCSDSVLFLILMERIFAGELVIDLIKLYNRVTSKLTSALLDLLVGALLLLRN